MSYLLSIVVPTKDRYYYLKFLIELIKGFNSDDIELIIQDNTENNSEILDYINEIIYPHLKYFHTKEQISVSLNADKAILHSTGKYACFIGDDDGVLPNIIDCVKWMEENSIDALIPANILYRWPNYIDFNGKTSPATLEFLNKKSISFSQSAKLMDVKKIIKKNLKKGFISRDHLPLVYHGIVERKKLDLIYKKGGTYFPGPSPDMANGVALCFVIEKFVFLDYPVIISGGSETHGGGIRRLKDMVAKIEDVPFLPSDTEKNWERKIPKVWTNETIWPESAIKALRYMNMENLINEINHNRILSEFIFKHPKYFKLALEVAESKLNLYIYLLFYFVKKSIVMIYKRFMYYLFKIPLGGVEIKGIQNINDAVSYLHKYYSSFNPFLCYSSNLYCKIKLLINQKKSFKSNNRQQI